MDKAARIARCFFRQGSTPAAPHVDLSGRVALVTGGASGIGLETSKGLAARGADVVVASRGASSEHAGGLEAIRAATVADKQDVVALPLDLAEPSSAVACARSVKEWLGDRPLDLLVMNAGVHLSKYAVNSQGVEKTWAVNVLGHAALFFELRDALLAAPAPRVVVVSAELHMFASAPVDAHRIEPSTFSASRAYFNSKAANILFAREVHRRFPKVVGVSLHPGVIDTNLAGDGAPSRVVSAAKRSLLLDRKTGAATTLRCSVEPGLRADGPPLYFVNTARLPIEPYPVATNEQTGARLYELLESLVADAKAADADADADTPPSTGKQDAS